MTPFARTGIERRPDATGLFHFVDAYLCESGDRELLEALPPFLALRVLIVAHPRWDPALPEGARRTLLRFARALLAPAAFDHRAVTNILGEAR